MSGATPDAAMSSRALDARDDNLPRGAIAVFDIFPAALHSSCLSCMFEAGQHHTLEGQLGEQDDSKEAEIVELCEDDQGLRASPTAKLASLNPQGLQGLETSVP